MDAELYCNILESTLVPFVQEKLPDHQFVQDNEPKYTSIWAQAFFEEKNINSTGGMLPRKPWPKSHRELVARPEVLFGIKGQATKQRRTGEGHQKSQAEEDNPQEVQKVHRSHAVQDDSSHSRGSRCSNTILKTALLGATAPCYVECWFNIALQVAKNGTFKSYHTLQKSMTNMGYILVLNGTLIKHSLQIETKWLHPFLAWTLFTRHFSLFPFVISMIDPFREDEICSLTHPLRSLGGA